MQIRNFSFKVLAAPSAIPSHVVKPFFKTETIKTDRNPCGQISVGFYLYAFMLSGIVFDHAKSSSAALVLMLLKR